MERLIAKTTQHSMHYRRSAVPSRRILLHAPEVPRRRKRVSGRSSAWARRLGLLRAGAVQARLDALQAGVLRRSAAPVHRAARYKVSIGYDFDAAHDEGDERRVADTFRVISLSFSNLGGPEVVQRILRRQGQAQLRGPHLRQPRRVLSHQAALPRCRREPTKRSSRSIRSIARRRTSACAWSRSTPRAASRSWCWSRRRISLEAMACSAEYWRHFDVDEPPEVLSYLKSNLKDLANHYHAQYQRADLAAEKPANYREALAVVPRVPRLVPEGRRVAADQLPAGRPAARERRTLAKRRRSTSARPTTTRRTRRPRPPAMPRSSPTART